MPCCTRAHALGIVSCTYMPQSRHQVVASSGAASGRQLLLHFRDLLSTLILGSFSPRVAPPALLPRSVTV